MTLSDFAMRIGLAVLFGFLIGLERQLTGHLAGIRTNLLVCMGACMFTVFSFLVSNLDLTRIAAQVVTGVSFLCSGIIIKDGVNVRGLDTAATIWCTAAIGVLTSCGQFSYAALACAVIIAVNIILRPLLKRSDALVRLDQADARYKVVITCLDERENDMRTLIKTVIGDSRLRWRSFETHNVGKEAVRIEVVLLAVGRRYDEQIEDIVAAVSQEEGVIAAAWENL